MNFKKVLNIGVSFIVYLLLQVLIFKDFAIEESAFCFIYITFILLLPFDLETITILLLGFLIGISVDIFYDTLGIHASACVLISYLREKLLPIIKPFGKEYDQNLSPTIPSMGINWFFPYAAILVFIHHIFLFFVEVSNINLFINTISATFFSVIFTLFMIVVFQYIFYGKKKEEY